MTGIAPRVEVELVRVQIEESESGLYRVTSKDIPGLGFCHSDLDRILDDLPNVIALLYKHTHGREVKVVEYEPGSRHEPMGPRQLLGLACRPADSGHVCRLTMPPLETPCERG